MRSLVDYQNANKNLEKARAKNKEVMLAEKQQQEACEKFEKLSEVAKGELSDFKSRRVVAYRKHLTELAELELKHSKVGRMLFYLCSGHPNNGKRVLEKKIEIGLYS